MSADPIQDALDAGIKRASDDSGSFENYDLDDLIEADRYLRSKAAEGINPFNAVKKSKIVPPGPVQ